MSKIKKFEDFSYDSEPIQEGFMDDVTGVIGKMIPLLGTGFIKTVKQKLAATLLEKLGILENSAASVIVQELVDSIEIKEMPGLLTGENANAEFLAPRLAQAVQEYIQRKGFDSLYVPFGIDPNGWLASTIRESFQEEVGKERLTEFFLNALGGESVGKDVLNKLDPKSKEQFKDALTQQLAKQYPTKAEGSGSSDSGGFMNTLGAIWDGFVGGAKEVKAGA
jgi:hypothetical protein